jgi:hypothetical protein
VLPHDATFLVKQEHRPYGDSSEGLETLPLQARNTPMFPVSKGVLPPMIELRFGTIMVQRKRTVGKRGYRTYIRSDSWQEVCARYNKSKLQKTCWCCGADDVPLDLHHKSYKTLGNENLNHLCRVCRGCHEQIHELARETGIHLWGATKAVRRRYQRKARKKARKR